MEIQNETVAAAPANNEGSNKFFLPLTVKIDLCLKAERLVRVRFTRAPCFVVGVDVQDHVTVTEEEKNRNEPFKKRMEGNESSVVSHGRKLVTGPLRLRFES